MTNLRSVLSMFRRPHVSGGELRERRAQIRTEAEHITRRANDLQRRVIELKEESNIRPTLDQLRREIGELPRDKDVADSPEILARRDGEADELSRRVDAVDAIAASTATEFSELEAEGAAIDAAYKAMSATSKELDRLEDERYERLTRSLAQGNVALQLVSVTIPLWTSWLASHKHAGSVHLDYYSAVATIVPVLLVAGFVELAALRRVVAGIWSVLSLTLPAIGAGSGTLYVLATHHSTPYAFYLTFWGLSTTFVALFGFVIQHAESGPNRWFISR